MEMDNTYANVDGFLGKQSRKKWETNDSQNVYDNVLLHNQTDAAPSGNKYFSCVEEYNMCVWKPGWKLMNFCDNFHPCVDWRDNLIRKLWTNNF